MTRKMMLIAGVAGLALTSPVTAERGGGRDKEQRAAAQQGGGQQGGGEKAQRQERQVQRAERPQRTERQMQRAERPQRPERQEMQRAERPQRMERQMQRAERPQRVERQQQRAERQIQRAERPQRVERQQQRAERQMQRVERQRPQRLERQQQRIERQAERPQRFERQQQRIDRRDVRIERKEQRIERQAQRLERGSDRRLAERLFARSDNRGPVRAATFDGRGYRPVAPLFASRDMRDMKPFKAKFDGARIVSIGDRYTDNYDWAPVPAFYGTRYVDNDEHYYRYNDDYGYAYQINRRTNLIGASYPLFGGYGIGDPWPQTYYSSYVPLGYQDYYYDTPDYYYRNDGYGIYQVDSSTQLITALVALLSGQSYGIGQALPASYGTYNVPLAYRSNYYDTDEVNYRYGDGFIYQMDPSSRQVSARYPIYGDDYYVGQAWPVAYPDYNVPYGYRSLYADTPQYQYRYANGGIYQVDPTNQLILALSALVSGDQFAVGQPMPAGYDIYNVPIDYRDRWADSDNEYYRYANGYVYQVDDDTGLIEEAFPVYT